MDRHAIDRDRAKRCSIDSERAQLRLRLDAEEFTADFVMRPIGAFDQHHVAAGRRQSAGRRRAGRPAADDDGLDLRHFRRPMLRRNMNQESSAAFAGMSACASAWRHSPRVSERATDMRPS